MRENHHLRYFPRQPINLLKCMKRSVLVEACHGVINYDHPLGASGVILQTREKERERQSTAVPCA